jgi:hypothetical protein
VEHSLKIAFVIILLLLFLLGAFSTLRDEYQKQLHTTDNKFLAFLKAFNEYVIKELIGTLISVLLLIVLGIFLLGGTVGLMIVGWKELLSTLNF